jgi:hypothetical protein
MEERSDLKERKKLKSKLIEAQTAMFMAMANKMVAKKPVVESDLE